MVVGRTCHTRDMWPPAPPGCGYASRDYHVPRERRMLSRSAGTETQIPYRESQQYDYVSFAWVTKTANHSTVKS